MLWFTQTQNKLSHNLWSGRAMAVVAAGLVLMASLGGCGCQNTQKQPTQTLQKVSFRLLWVPQAQFAGVLVADGKGFFEEEGIDLDIRPAGPDLKPHVTVASGTDDMGITIPNSILSANSNGADLIAVAQEFQDSANRYVAKKSTGIKTLKDVKGRKVGLWTGGDEVEFMAMLGKVGLTEKDVEVIPQGFTTAPFLEGEYDVSMVTTYNELNQILKSGVGIDELTIISPDTYECAIVGDVVFTTKSYADKNPELVTKVVRAILKGWQYAKDHPEEAVEIIVKSNQELAKEEQVAQLRSALELVFSREALQPGKGIGYISATDYETAKKILVESKQITKPVEVADAIELKFWEAAKAAK